MESHFMSLREQWHFPLDLLRWAKNWFSMRGNYNQDYYKDDDDDEEIEQPQANTTLWCYNNNFVAVKVIIYINVE